MALSDGNRRHILDSPTIPEDGVRVKLHSDATRLRAADLLAGGAMDAPPHPDPDRYNGTELERNPEGWLPLRPDAPWEGLYALRDLVARLRYKPGWRLTVDVPTFHDGAWLIIRAQVPDAYASQQAGEVDTQTTTAQVMGMGFRMQQDRIQEVRFMAVPYLLERWGEWLRWGDDTSRRRAMGDMLRWVRKCLGIFELHERDEFMLLDGVRVFDPHEGQLEGALRLHSGNPTLPG